MDNTVSDINNAKTTLRKRLSSLRKSLSKEERDLAANALLRHDISALGFHNGSILSGYYPIRSEFNCLPFLEKIRKLDLAIALPVVQCDGKGLLFREWTSHTNLVSGDLNILTPDQSSDIVLPDALLIPLLAFDRSGYRLGYGKGHYDRTIADLKTKKNVTLIGIAFDFQEVDAVPHDQFDQRLEWILTPSGLQKLGE